MFHVDLFQKTVAKQGVVPTSFGAATATTGANIVRGSARSMMIVVNHALPSQTAGTGTPTGTITVKLTDGATTSPVTAVTMSATIPGTDIAAAGVDVYFVNLEGLNSNIKVTATADLTAAGGGNTPLCLSSVDVILGDFAIEPQPSAVSVYARS